MTIRLYKSTDASAPVLTGLAGSLLTVLGAILVDGYGAKAACGWTRAFADSANKAMYLSAGGAVGTLKLAVAIDDSAPRAAPFANGTEARLRVGEAATNVTTLTTQFGAANYFIRKSYTADGTARPWIAIGDGRTLYFFAQTGDYGQGWASFMVGEIYSTKPTQDNFNAMVIARTIEQVVATPHALPAQENLPLFTGLTAGTTGHNLCRIYTEIATGAQATPVVQKHGNPAHSAASMLGLCTYPNPVDASIQLAPITVVEVVGGFPVIRGRLRGLWHFLHPIGAPVNHLDTWSGSGALAGKTFLAIRPTPNSDGIFVLETSDTWEIN